MSDDHPKNNIFSKLSTSIERERLIGNIKSLMPTIAVFNENLERVFFNFADVNSNVFVGSLSDADFNRIVGWEEVTVLFSITGDQYFLKTKMKMFNSKIKNTFAFDFSKDVYKLQRRNFFRVNVPEDKEIIFDVKNIVTGIDGLKRSEKKIKKQFCLNDLSAGGLSFRINVLEGEEKAKIEEEIETEEELFFSLEEGDLLVGQIILSESAKVNIEARFCHKKPIKIKGGKSFVFGCSFNNLSSKDEQYITATVLDMNRDWMTRK